MESFDLNKMEQQLAYPPQIKDEAARRAKRAIFPSLIWGEERVCSQKTQFFSSLMRGWHVEMHVYWNRFLSVWNNLMFTLSWITTNVAQYFPEKEEQ